MPKTGKLLLHSERVYYHDFSLCANLDAHAWCASTVIHIECCTHCLSFRNKFVINRSPIVKRKPPTLSPLVICNPIHMHVIMTLWTQYMRRLWFQWSMCSTAKPHNLSTVNGILSYTECPIRNGIYFRNILYRLK